MIGEDNFQEDILISPCVGCCWNYSDKCKRCVHRNRISPMRYYQPTTSPFKPNTTSSSHNSDKGKVGK